MRIGSCTMSSKNAASRTPAYQARQLPPGVILLVAAAALLLGSGALLSIRYGSAVALGDSVLAAIAWCF
jgi:hypothetical protein